VVTSRNLRPPPAYRSCELHCTAVGIVDAIRPPVLGFRPNPLLDLSGLSLNLGDLILRELTSRGEGDDRLDLEVIDRVSAFLDGHPPIKGRVAGEVLFAAGLVVPPGPGPVTGPAAPRLGDQLLAVLLPGPLLLPLVPKPALMPDRRPTEAQGSSLG
jgi:hypothetical protein